MADSSNNKQVGFRGSAVGEPAPDHKKHNTTTYVSRQGNNSNFHQKTSKTSFVDEQTGAYVSSTTEEVRETLKDGAGRVVNKDEHYTTKTSGPGGKSGYSEYHVHKSVHSVESTNYGDGSGSQGDYGNKGHYSGDYLLSFQRLDAV